MFTDLGKTWKNNRHFLKLKAIHKLEDETHLRFRDPQESLDISVSTPHNPSLGVPPNLRLIVLIIFELATSHLRTSVKLETVKLRQFIKHQQSICGSLAPVSGLIHIQILVNTCHHLILVAGHSLSWFGYGFCWINTVKDACLWLDFPFLSLYTLLETI
jgi:hypothetical protein